MSYREPEWYITGGISYELPGTITGGISYELPGTIMVYNTLWRIARCVRLCIPLCFYVAVAHGNVRWADGRPPSLPPSDDAT